MQEKLECQQLYYLATFPSVMTPLTVSCSSAQVWLKSTRFGFRDMVRPAGGSWRGLWLSARRDQGDRTTLREFLRVKL